MLIRELCDRRFATRIASLLIVLLGSARVVAADRAYVMPDGKSFELIRSNTEFGVTLGDEDPQVLARRLRTSGKGELRFFSEAPRAKVQLLTVPKADAERRSKVVEDPGVIDARPVYRFKDSEAPVISSGEVVLKVRPSLSEARRVQLWTEYGVTATPETDMPHVYRLGPFDPDFDEVELAQRLAADRRVEWANPNFRRMYKTNQVSDPLFGDQWHLEKIEAEGAWIFGEGADVLFGIFDDAVDVTHEDLRVNYTGEGHDPSVPPSASDADDPRPKTPFDMHGTAVIGLAVATANSVGGRGVSHLSRFTASRGALDNLTDAQSASAFTFARQQEVDVHVNSWGLLSSGEPTPPIVTEAIRLNYDLGRDPDGAAGDNPPLGMVIVFSTGNEGLQVVPGFEFASLPQVIGVGSTNEQDELSEFSNFGASMDVVAPGEFILTTDNTDGSLPNNGFNDGGAFGDIANGRYTRFFGGTSASCPIVAGVAGIILSINPLLTATDVRIILEHTADQVSPGEADYHPITSRSLLYGHGRVNARRAAVAANQSRSNGNRTWPDRPARVSASNATLRWHQPFGTNEFLVVESDSTFEFVPTDGVCYSTEQIGCAGGTPTPLPDGVRILGVGCDTPCSDVSCDPEDGNLCKCPQCVGFLQPAGTKFFAIYGRSTLGRYSWGVAADSTGQVQDAGEVLGRDAIGGDSGGSDGGGGSLPGSGPAVTISVSPLRGKSPLTVNFAGNAVSDVPIDETKTAWDFDVDDNVAVDARTRNATHTYTVGEGVTRTFVARFTMVDTDGMAGSEEVAITVEGERTSDDTPDDDSQLRIIVGLPGTPGSNVDGGAAPLDVLLSVDASGLPGQLQSVSWDLGDGTRATTLVVPHTYLNPHDVDLRIPITVTVTTVTTGGIVVTTTATRLITVSPGDDAPPSGPPVLPGTGAEGEGGRANVCGALGWIQLSFMFLSLAFLRRRCG